MAKDMKPIGMIGLGFIGIALSERLMEAGFEVIGFDIDAAKVARFAALGGRPASSVVEVGLASAEIVLTVFNTAQVIDVIEGPGGLVEGAAGAELTVICVTTCEPDPIATLARRAGNLGIAVIEFPIAGHSGQVRAGAGTGLIAGDPKAVARVDAVMHALCPRRFEIGKPGDAARAKLAINLVSQLNRSALAEGIVFATRLGLDPSAFLKVVSASPAHSDVMEAKGEKMVQSDYAPQSRIAQTLKDAQLILEEAHRVGQPLPLMEINTALLAAAIELGGPERDPSAVIEALRQPTLRS